MVGKLKNFNNLQNVLLYYNMTLGGAKMLEIFKNDQKYQNDSRSKLYKQKTIKHLTADIENNQIISKINVVLF